MYKFGRLALVAICGFLLVACGAREPYKPQLVHQAGNAHYQSIWLRDVNFEPTLAEVYPVPAERQLVVTTQQDLANDARKWVAHYLTEKGLAAASESSAKFILDVDIRIVEIVGASKGMAYRTSFNYRVIEAGESEALIDRRFDDSGYSEKPDNLTWGNVIAAGGAGLAAGLTGIPAVTTGATTTSGSESGLQPAILQKALIYGWRDAIARNADRYFTDLPSSINYNASLRKAEREAAAAAAN